MHIVFTSNDFFPGLIAVAGSHGGGGGGGGSFDRNTATAAAATQLSEKDILQLFRYFDEDNSQSISVDEFLNGIRDPLVNYPERCKLVAYAFDKLDNRKLGYVTAQDLANSYYPSKHPEVLAKHMSTDEALREFLENFDSGRELEGMVTKGEFFNYYSNINYFIHNDLYFDLLVRNTWNISLDQAKKMGLVDRLRQTAGGGSEVYGELAPTDEADILALYKEAAKKFNAKQVPQARATFESIQRLLKDRGLPDTHPECIKVEKALIACTKR